MSYKLLTPGPVQVHPETLKASAEPVISHRGPEFRRLYKEVTAKLEELSNAEEALVYAGSGTTAVDAMAWSLVKPGDTVLVVITGEFGHRLANTLEERGAKVEKLESQPGHPVPPEEISETLRKTKPQYLAIVSNETSTGLSYRNLQEITREANSQGAKVIVDAVSGFPVEPLNIEEWGIYAAATCSHKALAAPPGLAINLLSREAATDLEENPPRNLPPSINLARNHEFYKEKTETPYTPPVTLLKSLNTALNQIQSKTLETYIQEHIEKAEILYSELPKTGYEPLVTDENYRSRTVTAFKTPPGTTSAEVTKYLLQNGYRIAQGMGNLKHRTIRIGVMGAVDAEDIRKVVDLLHKITLVHK